jgi:alcohol dehydrogenase
MGPQSTDDLATPFRFEYDPATVRYGPDCVADLSAELAALDCDRALVVTGATVGETPAVMDPIRAGLGERLAGVFAGTTPGKRLGTAYDALEQYRETAADAIVAVGGGSSLDVATVLSILAATDRSPEAVGAELVESGTLPVPASGLPPVLTVPTTLAGADLSQVAGVTADPATCPVSEPASGGVSGPQLMPAVAWYDPELLATTPRGVLAASAMNGFDKGIETLYARNRTPVTDATAMRGLGLLADGLLAFGDGDGSPATYQRLARGVMLVQYGISRPEGTTLSLIHAFGHGLTRTYDVQQGAAHAVVAPHVLRWLFEACDGRRALLAEALSVEERDDPAEAVVERVADIAAALDLPTRLRDVDGPERDEFPDVAEAVLADAFMNNAPTGLDPTREDIERVLDAAW